MKTVHYYVIEEKILKGSCGGSHPRSTVLEAANYLAMSNVEFVFQENEWPDCTGGTVSFAWIENYELHMICWDYVNGEDEKNVF